MHKIDMKNFHRQAYDTTASTSSSGVGVQACIKKGISMVQNFKDTVYTVEIWSYAKFKQSKTVMMDSCQQAVLFFFSQFTKATVLS
ncbi:MAG: hypothetical protein ORN98_08025 [Alphaproteobacteria bacterium]|nr:hypothetical protein [Alphaproteobacteria bacterium]